MFAMCWRSWLTVSPPRLAITRCLSGSIPAKPRASPRPLPRLLDIAFTPAHSEGARPDRPMGLVPRGSTRSVCDVDPAASAAVQPPGGRFADPRAAKSHVLYDMSEQAFYGRARAGTFAASSRPRPACMTPRISSSAALVATLLACKNSGPADPEPALPRGGHARGLRSRGPRRSSGCAAAGVPRAQLAVLDYAPQGRTAGGAAIKVRFNQPVVALGVEQIPDASRFLAFDPPLEGDASLPDPRPAGLPPRGAAAGRHHVHGPLRARAGRTRRSAVGQGRRVDVRDAAAAGAGADPLHRNDSPPPASRRDTPFVVSFDHPTTLAEVRAHLRGDRTAARSLRMRSRRRCSCRSARPPPRSATGPATTATSPAKIAGATSRSARRAYGRAPARWRWRSTPGLVGSRGAAAARHPVGDGL